MTKITNAALLNDVKRVVTMKKNTSRATYRKAGKFASETVERRFKGWKSAVKRATSK